GRKDAPWKLKVNGVTMPFAPTATRSTRTTSKCTATLKDACAAPPVNALSVQTRARSLQHCAPHARSSSTVVAMLVERNSLRAVSRIKHCIADAALHWLDLA